MMDTQQPFDMAFSPGQVVYCKTRLDEEYEGEVVAFDLLTKILVTKCPSQQKDPNRNDVHFLNLGNIKDVKIIKETPKDFDCSDLPPLLMDKLVQRTKAARNERRELVEAVENNVSEDGLRLFAHLSKTIDNGSKRNLKWEKQSIVVLGSYSINPPYKETDCGVHEKAPPPANSLPYVQGLVAKYWEDRKK